MKPRLHTVRRYALLSSLLALTAALPPACQGTETDNPVIVEGPPPEGWITPDRSRSAPEPPPGCVPPSEPRLDAVRRYERPPLFRTDGSEVELPLEGYAHQVLALSEERAVLSVQREPPTSQDTLPSAEALGLRDYLVLLDTTSEGVASVVSRMEVEGEYWQLRWHDGVLWVLSAILEEEACEIRTNLCGSQYYEGLRLSGYQLNDEALTPVHRSEYAFGFAQLGTEGFTVWHDRDISVFPFSAPLSSSPLTLNVPGMVPNPGSVENPGPVRITGQRVQAAWLSQEGPSQLLEYDLAASERPLLPVQQHELPELREPNANATFFEDYLWFNTSYTEFGPRLFRLAPEGSQDPPVAVPLPTGLTELYPLAERGLAQSAAAQGTVEGTIPDGTVAAIAGSRDASGTQQRSWVRISDLSYEVLETWAFPAGSLSNTPPSLLEQGLQVVESREGSGLPLQVDWLPPPGSARPRAIAHAALEVDAVLTTLTLTEAGFAADGSIAPQQLVVERGDSTTRLPSMPSVQRLLVSESDSLAVLVATSRVSECEQTGLDCSQYAPGVQLMSLRGEPRLATTLPFPTLNLPAATDLQDIDVSWQPDYEDTPALQLDDGRFVFWADVALTCTDAAVCAQWEIPYVPVEEANVIAVSDIEVWGGAHRQYFFALDPGRLAGGNGEARFVPIGSSELEGPLLSGNTDPRFGEPLVSGQTLLATRLQRTDGQGNRIDRNSSRVIVDAFEVAGNSATRLPPINAPGRPLAILSSSPSSSSRGWLTVEPVSGLEGENNLHVCTTPTLESAPFDPTQPRGPASAQTASMSIVQTESPNPSLGESRFFLPTRLDIEAEVAAVGDGVRNVAFTVAEPADACGQSILQSWLLDASASNPNAISLADSISLPANRWRLLLVQDRQVLLERHSTYALFEWDEDGMVTLVSAQSSPYPLSQPQLQGRHLRGSLLGRPFELTF